MSTSPKKEVRMAQMNLGKKLTVAALLCQLILAFHTLPALADEHKPESSSLEQTTAISDGVEGVKGTATYYAKRYNGRRTHSGARYSPQKLTAAHAILPMGSRVKVVNPANDREVVVTVNDRCRKKKSEHIDLSRAAAKKLGFLGKGLIQVRIIQVDEQSS